MNWLHIFSFEYWRQFFSTDLLSSPLIINLLDILVVWFIIYKLIQLLRKTKAIQLLKGVAVFIAIRAVAEIIGLHTLSWLMDQVIIYGVIAGIVIFQPEIRRGLEHLGRTPMFTTSKAKRNNGEQIMSAFDKALQYMAKRKIGALITIEKNTLLDEYIETGIPLDADISAELLINIFIPNTPLHDGAVIVRQDKIAVACAYLPLSESLIIPKHFGTRHRAAVGVSEVSDALTLIVSEETGEVSIAYNNHLYSNLSQEEYLLMLKEAFVQEEKDQEKKNFFATIWQEFNKVNRGDK
ncbi:MAG: diadenylate cyclase CdaA [Enterococcus lemanii]|jgi:diadenylate cyclase